MKSRLMMLARCEGDPMKARWRPSTVGPRPTFSPSFTHAAVDLVGEVGVVVVLAAIGHALRVAAGDADEVAGGRVRGQPRGLRGRR